MASLTDSAKPFRVEMEPSRSASAGAATAFLLKSIAARAGSYAPGIQDRLFLEVQRDSNGANLDRVQRWFIGAVSELHRLGYRLSARRVAFRTRGILDWVESGGGHRGAVLATDAGTLREGDESAAGEHAVAVTMDAELALVDPWPGHGAPERVPATLEAAHRARKYGALVVYWAGWS